MNAMAPRRRKQPEPEQLLGSLEARVMKDLWAKGESSVGDVLERLNSSSRKQLAYNTVMSVMARLAQKGLLRRYRDGRAYLYTPAVSREGFAETEASRAAGEMLEDYGRAAVAGWALQLHDDPELHAELERKLRELDASNNER